MTPIPRQIAATAWSEAGGNAQGPNYTRIEATLPRAPNLRPYPWPEP